ncbi:pimeloyl-CoA dehydrogenase small subunit [Kineobactrum sediminis]|uniref:Pimeloyl-CoA dehydrogenase small subunit n=1 Tax=Kineobactrum sediminis TaxID=1905677 RepID=A0A2N5Y5U0_9GAMM|nr:acyl-CoA dehydrogenase family protein [Kineobactrum sediminis]PLW83760.1 pimeloyl-CoA dehydrogenase small subunit [Kineobactrum sediminis]
MNFDLTEEQQLIQGSVARFIKDNYALDTRQQLVASATGYSDTYWSMMAELGWLGLPFAEENGGFGGNQVDTMVLMEQFGKGLVLEPYLASVVMGGGALKRASDALKEAVLPAVIDGTCKLCLGYAEPQSRFDLHDVATTAAADGGNFIISGHKSMVLHGGSASRIVISARTSGERTDVNGISLFLVEAEADGIQRESFQTVDGLRAAEITFKDVRVPAKNLIGELDAGYAILRAVANDAILALAAEAVGAMEMLYKDTVAYTQERVQFDHPLADFQVLQHRMVDMFMEYEQCKSLLFRATLETVQNSDELAQRSIHALKHLVGRAGIFIGENAVQLHGGMGMAEELRVGHYFKRILVIDSQFGNADYHLQRFAI